MEESELSIEDYIKALDTTEEEYEKSTIDFYRCAICDIYKFDYSNLSSQWGKMSQMDLTTMEYFLSQELKVPNKFICNSLCTRSVNIKWRSEVSFTTSSHNLTHLCPEVTKSSNMFWREFGSNRFISVDVRGNIPTEQQYFALDTFFNKPFIFGNRIYKFLGGKKQDSKGSKSTIKDTLFTAWYFAEDNVKRTNQYLRPITVSQVWAWLGDFAEISSFSKLNARISLGFSTTLPCCSVKSSNINVICDLFSQEGNIMTDGCGFISDSLVDTVLYAISSGLPAVISGKGIFSRKKEHLPLPTVIQIRLRCSKGLFKGCLLVTKDVNICPSDSVVVRESMRKARGSSQIISEADCLIEVCNTFEHPQLLRDGDENLNFQDCVPACLNRFACLLLQHLGVPMVMFQDLMRAELDKIMRVHIDRRASYRLVRKNNRATTDDYSLQIDSGDYSIHSFEIEDDTLDEDSGDESNFDMTQLSRALLSDKSPNPFDERLLVLDRKNKHDAVLAFELLSTGHPLHEPHLMQAMRKLQKSSYKRLRRANIRMRNAMYLVGLPDPFDVLEEGEVFVSYPCDGLGGVKHDRKWNDHGDVIVMRNPMLHPGDVRKLRAVHSPIISQSLVGTSGGVVFFSTRGSRSAANEMGGGDFDGDLYLLLLSNNSMVEHITPVVSFVDEQIVDTKFSRSDQSDNIAWDIFIYMCESGSQNDVGKYTNAWLAYSDHLGPDDPNSLECTYIVYKALDAAKTSIKIQGNRRLLDKPKPHYLETKESRKSVSILGLLYDMVKEAEDNVILSEEAHKRNRDFFLYPKSTLIDPDMIYGHLNDNMTQLDTKWWDHIRKYKSSLSYAFEIDGKLQSDMIMATKDKYREEFINDSLALMRVDKAYDSRGDYAASEANTRLLLYSMKSLASLIYKITYADLKAKIKEDCNTDQPFVNYTTSFCWEVCTKYLNLIKFEAQKKFQDQNPVDIFLESEIKFIFSF